jgi:uncharacterized membrane protein YphA (DoxX/SURF4 family)
MKIALWIVQAALALMFLFSGFGKITWPYAELVAKIPWGSAVSEPLFRFIGISEVLGAIGVILPAATRIKPSLTPLAAAGLASIMALAFVFHVARGELYLLPWNIGLGGLALFVAWGRWKKAPIAPRGSPAPAPGVGR